MIFVVFGPERIKSAVSDSITLSDHRPPIQTHNQKLSYGYFTMKDFVYESQKLKYVWIVLHISNKF